MKTGILFDLDGTLLDTLEDLTDATNYALSQFGFPARTLEEIRSFVGNGAWNQIRMSVPSDTHPDTVQQVLEVYRPYYATHCQRKTRPYAGITEVLTALQKMYPLAIVTNKPDVAVQPLCRAWFPGIYALGERSDCPRKPAPDMVFRAMKAIGAERCIYVGDSEVDVRTASNAGAVCLSVLWGFRDREALEAAGAEHFCAHPSQLLKKIEELIHGK